MSYAEQERARAAAHSRLMFVIADHRAAGENIPCLDVKRSHWWISGDRDEREAAAHRCMLCPALASCTRYVEAFPEPEGVWAGRKPRSRAVSA